MIPFDMISISLFQLVFAHIQIKIMFPLEFHLENNLLIIQKCNFYILLYIQKLMLFLHKRFLMEKNHTATSLVEQKDLMHSKQFSTFAEKFKSLKFH